MVCASAFSGIEIRVTGNVYKYHRSKIACQRESGGSLAIVRPTYPMSAVLQEDRDDDVFLIPDVAVQDMIQHRTAAVDFRNDVPIDPALG